MTTFVNVVTQDGSAMTLNSTVGKDSFDYSDLTNDNDSIFYNGQTKPPCP